MPLIRGKSGFIGLLIGLYSLACISYLLLLAGIVSKELTDLVYILFPLLAVFTGISTFKSYGWRSAHGSAIFLMTAGFFAWAIAEIIWVIMIYIFNIDPFPSVADVFFLAGYPLLAAGAIKELRRNKVTLTFHQIFILLAVLANLGAFVGYFGIYLAYNPGDPVITNVISIAYGLADFLFLSIFIFVLFLSLQYSGGRLFYPWFMIFLGMVLFTSADVLFAMYTEEYGAGGGYLVLIDLLWLASYGLFAYGLFDFSCISKMAKAVIGRTDNFSNE